MDVLSYFKFFILGNCLFIDDIEIVNVRYFEFWI